MKDDLTIIGTTNARNKYIPFGIKQADRLSHTLVLGKTGTGKTTLLKNLIYQDICAGRGCALLDPHGDMVRELVTMIPINQRHRLIYLNIPDPNLEWGYNPLAYVSAERRPMLASGILEIFKKLWPNEWGVRMEHLFRNAVLTLLEQPESNLGEVIRLFTDKVFRAKCLRKVKNQRVLDYWHREFDKYSFRTKGEATIPIANKLGAFLADPKIDRILCHPKKKIRLRSAMDESKIILVNLAKGQIGSDATNLFGSLFLTSISLAAYSRSDVAEDARKPFHLFCDEAHNFLTLSTASMMSEVRKYGLSLTVAGQYLHQYETDVREAILGNAGTLICFRIGPIDSAIMQKEFGGLFDQADLLRLANYHFYVVLMIDGMPSRGFSATSLALH